MKEFEYFDHEADAGIRGFGKTVEKAFENGAKAMFNLMVDVEKVERKRKIDIRCEADDIEGLFVEWLNELLAQKDIEGMAFSSFKVEKIKRGENYKLNGWCEGEVLDPEKHEVKTEVKAATYSVLKVGKEGDVFVAQCVVDV